MAIMIGGFLFCAMGIALVIYSGRAALMGLASRHWRRARGVIASTSVIKAHDAEGGLLYRLAVVYRYNDGLHERTGTRVFFGDAIALPLWAIRDGAWPPYEIGDVVDVFFSSNAHLDSVLKPGIHKALPVIFGGGLVFLVIGISVIITM